MLRRLARWTDSRPLTRRIRRRLIDAPVASRLVAAADRRRLRRVEQVADPRERAKRRWRSAPPGPGLTWGVELTGEAAVDAAQAHGAFGPGRTVLEVGPGYGRVLRSCLDRRLDFARYIGLDVSEKNVAHLRETFDDPRVAVLCGDAESAELPEPADTVLSFLTFKHMYPSFEPALRNLQPQLRPGALVIFDLIEGYRRYFNSGGRTYVREYRRPEVEEILLSASLEPAAFDTIEHEPGRERLLVVARSSM